MALSAGAAPPQRLVCARRSAEAARGRAVPASFASEISADVTVRDRVAFSTSGASLRRHVWFELVILVDGIVKLEFVYCINEPKTTE